MPPKEKYLPILRRVVVFRYLDEALLREMLEIAEIVEFMEGERVVAEGEISPHVFAVLSGSVNVMVDDAGHEVFVSAIGKGDVFGEAGIFLKTPRTASVLAAEPAVLLRIHREELLAFIKRQPGAGIKILMVIIYSLLKKLRDANQELAFERKADINQDDIDSLLGRVMDD